MPIATFINMLAVLIGGSIGLLLGNRFPEHIKKITFQAIGLFSILLGIKMGLDTQQPLIMVFSLIIGGILGELSKIETKTNQLGDWVRKKVKSDNDKFAEGLTTTFLIFCVGSMTILGAIEEGLNGNRELILTKSVMDGFTAIALATIYGSSVIFSVIPMLIFQGGITILAAQAQHIFNPIITNEMGAVGGVMIIGIGINILEIQKIKVINLLPAILVVVLLMFLQLYLPSL